MLGQTDFPGLLWDSLKNTVGSEDDGRSLEGSDLERPNYWTQCMLKKIVLNHSRIFLIKPWGIIWITLLLTLSPGLPASPTGPEGPGRPYRKINEQMKKKQSLVICLCAVDKGNHRSCYKKISSFVPVPVLYSILFILEFWIGKQKFPCKTSLLHESNHNMWYLSFSATDSPAPTKSFHDLVPSTKAGYGKHSNIILQIWLERDASKRLVMWTQHLSVTLQADLISLMSCQTELSSHSCILQNTLLKWIGDTAESYTANICVSIVNQEQYLQFL